MFVCDAVAVCGVLFQCRHMTYAVHFLHVLLATRLVTVLVMSDAAVQPLLPLLKHVTRLVWVPISDAAMSPVPHVTRRVSTYMDASEVSCIRIVQNTDVNTADSRC